MSDFQKLSGEGQDSVFFIGPETEPPKGFWKNPLSPVHQRLVWGVLLAFFGAVLVSMRVPINDLVFWIVLLLIGASIRFTAWLLSKGYHVTALILVFPIHFVLAMSMMVPALPLVASFFGHLAGIVSALVVFRHSPSRINPLMFATLIGIMAYVSATRHEFLNEVEVARDQNPFTKIDSRLSYEKSARPLINEALFGGDQEKNRRAANWLDEMDEEWDPHYYGNSRTDKLSQIHSSYVNRFANTPGFGVGRMPVRQPVPLPEIDIQTIRPEHFTDSSVWPDGMDQGNSRMTFRGELPNPWRSHQLPLKQEVAGFDYHFAASKDFLNPETFGYVNEETREVAGFIEHAFHNAPPKMEHEQRVWSLSELKLMSLLQFDEPQVYETEHLPRMDEISSMTVPVRDLNDFESKSLKRLLKGEETVLHVDGDRLVMLGALRARKQCMECHSVDHGELLGAFTYGFRADNIRLPRELTKGMLSDKDVPEDSAKLSAR